MKTSIELLRDIQDGAVSSTTPVAELLRKCQVLAARLPLPELGDWVRHELDGYPQEAELPPYRVLHGIAKGHFLGPFGSGLKNATLPASNLPPDLRDWARRALLRQPIAVLQDLALKPEEGLCVMWPGDLVASVQGRFYENLSLAQAWLQLASSDVKAAVEAVRNRILSFALDAEKLVPAGASSLPSSDAGALSQVFHTHIYGTVGNYAQGGTISQTYGVTAGDLESLLHAMLQSGVPATDVAELKEAVLQDGEAPRKCLGARVAAWLGTAVAKAASGAWQVATSTATTVLPKLLERYYNLQS